MSENAEKQSHDIALSTSNNNSQQLAPKLESHFDDAAKYLGEHESEHGNYTEAESKRVLRKIDLIITPLLWVTTILAAVDVSVEPLVL